MKKFLSVLLALMLAFSCTAAFAETEAAPAPAPMALKSTSAIAVNGEMLAKLIPMMTGGAQVDEAAMTLVNSLVSLLNKANVTALMQADGGKLVLSIGDAAAMDATLSFANDKIVVDTSLLPSYSIDLTTAVKPVLAQLQSMVESLGQLAEPLTALLQKVMTEYMASIQGLLGTAEAVEIVNGDITYTTAQPFTMTTGDAGALYVKLMDTVLADETVKAILTSAQVTDEQIAQIRAPFDTLAATKGTEQDTPLMAGTVFTTADQACALIDATMAVPSATVSTTDGTTTTTTTQNMYAHYVVDVVTAEAGMNMNMQMTMATVLPEDGDWAKLDAANVMANTNYSVSFNAEGVAMLMAMSVQGMQIAFETKSTFDFATGINVNTVSNVYFMDMTTPIFSATDAMQTVPAETIQIAEGKTMLDVTTLTDENKAALLADLQANGLALLMQNLYAAAPDEMMVIINAMTPQQQTTEVTTEPAVSTEPAAPAA